MIGDCWNRIGVHGDSSCPELATYVHCRNCPLYSTAAKELLDVELPPGYLTHWTQHIAEKRPPKDTGTHSVIVFRVGIDWMALPTAVFKEITSRRPIHTIPHRRGGFVLGVTNVRGQLIVCVSLRKLLGIDDGGEHVAAERLLVLAWAAKSIVCPVSDVYGVHHFRARDLSEPPGSIAKAATKYTRAVARWDNKLVALLDDDLLSYTVDRSLASTAI